MVIMMFGKPDCQPCKLKRPMLEQLCEQLGVPFLYADVTVPPYGEMARDMGIRGVPTVLGFNIDITVPSEKFRYTGAAITPEAVTAAVQGVAGA